MLSDTRGKCQTVSRTSQMEYKLYFKFVLQMHPNSNWQQTVMLPALFLCNNPRVSIGRKHLIDGRSSWNLHILVSFCCSLWDTTIKKTMFSNLQSSYENVCDNIPHNHFLIRIGHVNRTYVHIVTNLWKRICNFENIEIMGISSPNAPTIICDLSQDEQVKQQCFKFWSHLTIRDTGIY